MMAKLAAVLTLLLALPLLAVDPAGQQPAPPSAPILTYTEVTTDGTQNTLGANRSVVDINSRVNIGINRALLDARIPKALNLPGLDPNIAARITLLSTVLASREQSIQQLKTAFSSAAAKTTMTPAELKDYYATVQQAARPAALIVRAAIRHPIPGSIFLQRQEFYSSRRTTDLNPANALDQYTIVFMAAADDMAKLQQDLEAAATQNGAYVRLGAWVQDRPQHLAGFDTMKQGDHFVVQRFNLQLSDAQKEELKNAAAAAKKINTDGLSALDLWRDAGQMLLKSVAENSNTAKCIRNLQTTIQTDQTEIGAATADLKKQYDDAKAKVDAYVALLDEVKKRYADGGTAAGMPADQFLIQTNDDMLSLIDQGTQLAADLETAAKTFKAIASTLSGAAKTDITNLASAAGTCAATAKTDADDWKKNILGQINALKTGSDFDRTALEFGQAVDKLQVDKVPDNTFLPLTYTGPRERGDALTVKLAAGTTNGPEVQLEEGDFVLYQTLPYIALKVGLIFAHPNGKLTTDTTGSTTTTTTTTETGVKHFQTAAAYSILLKKDSPKRMWWNTLFDPGVGLNLSALDFNHDDTPELGVGGVVSLFRDIVQGGYGYNVPLGKWYAFFGLRLPLPSFTINGAQTSTTTTTTTPAQ